VKKQVHLVVRGLVQGVGFGPQPRGGRTLWNLAGFVRNLGNGDVEIIAEEKRTLWNAWWNGRGRDRPAQTWRRSNRSTPNRRTPSITSLFDRQEFRSHHGRASNRLGR